MELESEWSWDDVAGFHMIDWKWVARRVLTWTRRERRWSWVDEEDDAGVTQEWDVVTHSLTHSSGG